MLSVSADFNNLFNTVIVLAILFSAYYFLKYYQEKYGHSTVARSNIDFNLYQVRDSENDNNDKKAANRLATINKEINRLVNYMKKNETPDKESADRLFNRWSKCELKETLEGDSSVAFTINKGSSIHMCVRNEDSMEDYNTGMFVILHELAHIMSVTEHHTDEFKHNFSKLIEIATKLGVYRPIDYTKNPQQYCGTTISTVP